MMSKLRDLTGQQFGRLAVIKRGEDKIYSSGKSVVSWECQCECGKTVYITGDVLTRPNGSKSCGCYNKDKQKTLHTKHGDTDSKLYGIWCSMKSRCYNPNNKAYGNYGGRGIQVCEEWRGSYSNFKIWAVENGYNESLSIDRINVDGDYCPNNCRWATFTQQANNRRSNRTITYCGETHNITEWASILGVSPKTIFNRIYSGWSPEQALLFSNSK